MSYNESCSYFSREYVGNPGPVPACNKKAVLEAFNCSTCEYNQKIEKGQGCCGLCGYSASLHKRTSEAARTSRFCDETTLCCIRSKKDVFEVAADEFCDFFAMKGVVCNE